MPVINMVEGADNCRVISMAQMIDIQCVADLLDAVLNIQAGSAVGIYLISDGKLDLICDVFDKSGWIVVDGSFHCSAPGVAQDQHKICPQVLHRIFNTAQLMIIDHISGKTDHKQISDPHRKNTFRYHAGV